MERLEACLAEVDDPAEAAARLEAALERIALAARATPPDMVLSTTDPDTAQIAARLDILISQIRAALGVGTD